MTLKVYVQFVKVMSSLYFEGEGIEERFTLNVSVWDFDQAIS